MRDGANEPSSLQQTLHGEAVEMVKESILSPMDGLEKVQGLVRVAHSFLSLVRR